MAIIEKRLNTKGELTHRVAIRRKNIEICKSFSNEEDANLYVFYKERLIDNLSKFDVPLKDRLTIETLMEMKMKSMSEIDKRTENEFKSLILKCKDLFGRDTFYQEISFDKWVKAANKLYDTAVYKGAKTEINKRKMSPVTLKRYFATISTAISYATSQGMELINHPLKVIQTFIDPLIKECKADLH